MKCLSCNKNDKPENAYFCPSCSFVSACAIYSMTGWKDSDRYGVDTQGNLYPMATPEKDSRHALFTE